MTTSSSSSSSSLSGCPQCPPPTCEITQQLTLANRAVYNGDFIITGVGTRNSGNGSMYLCGIPKCAAVTSAWLYWNVIMDNCAEDAEMISFGVGDIGSCSPLLYIGTCVGMCGNTCWSALPNPDLTETNTTSEQLRNRVYKADVTSIVTGNGYYCVDGLPYTAEPIATAGINNAQYPGCAGSQGAALFVIWEWINPSPHESDGPREISWYDGAVLLAGSANIPLNGGVSSYTIIHPTSYFGNVNLGFAVGDAREAPATAIFNNKKLMGSNPDTFFMPAQGKLLFAESGFQPANGQSTNVMQVTSPTNECFAWFLWAISGNACPCTISTQLVTIGPGPGFGLIGNRAVSFGRQYAGVQILKDTCNCLSTGSSSSSSASNNSEDGVVLVVNGVEFAIPPQGVLVHQNNTVEVRLKTKGCVPCDSYPPYCAGSSSSSSSSKSK